MSDRSLLVALLGFLSFTTVYVHVVVSPVLVDVAAEFGITTGAAGLLVVTYGLPGIFVSLLAGPFSDRRGRKPLLVWGTVVMSAFTVLGAFAASFALLLLSRVLAGVGASLVFPNITASVGDAFEYRERGRAMGTIIAMNTMASIIGVPLAGIVAELSSWRVSLVVVGVLGVLAAGVLWSHFPDVRPAGTRFRPRELYARIFQDVSARGALVSSLGGSIFWFSWATYLVAFFQTTFALSTGMASLVALTTGLGVIAGSQLGGRLGDRVGHKAIVGWSIVIGGVLLFIETNLILGVAFAAVLNFLVSAAGGARFATNTALLTEQAPGARGTMMALNSAIVSVGIVAGALLGGILIDEIGFGSLGWLALLAAVGSGLVVWRWVTESTADLAAGEATE